MMIDGIEGLDVLLPTSFNLEDGSMFAGASRDTESYNAHYM